MMPCCGCHHRSDRRRTLHIDGQQRGEELLGIHAVEFGRAFLHRSERFFAFDRFEPVEGFAVGLLAPGIRLPHARHKELMRREGKLISLFRRAFDERTRPIHPVATAPRTGKLPIDEDRNPALAAGRRQLILRNYGIGGRGEKGDFLLGQDLPGFGRRFGSRGGGLYLRRASRNSARCSGNAGARDTCALEKFATWNQFIRHSRPPKLARIERLFRFTPRRETAHYEIGSQGQRNAAICRTTGW